jgi:thioesterase domain-containing protein
MERAPTDKRIDDLADRQGRFEENVDRRFDRFERRVDAQFDRVDARFEQFEDKVDARFEQVDRRFEQVVTKEEFTKAEEAHRERMDGLNARFDRWGKIVTGGTVTIVGAVIIKLLGI